MVKRMSEVCLIANPNKIGELLAKVSSKLFYPLSPFPALCGVPPFAMPPPETIEQVKSKADPQPGSSGGGQGRIRLLGHLSLTY